MEEEYTEHAAQDTLSAPAIEPDDRGLLEALLADPTFKEAEAQLSQFNIFEALGAVHQELRHSDFLAFLLNPQESHGLRDHFAKRLLMHVAAQAAPELLPMSREALVTLSLKQLEVRREWQRVDILLVDEPSRLVIIIENKVKSQEHSQQLQRYWDLVAQHYPDWHVLGIFLTPTEELPTDDRYFPLSYQAIHDLLVELTALPVLSQTPDVSILLRHYTEMLRRHILSNSEIAALCRRLYRKHQRALDLIFAHRPTPHALIADYLAELIEADQTLILDTKARISIRFIPKRWDHPDLRQGTGWTSSGRMLLFEFVNRPKQLKLALYIGPGPQEIRQQLFQMAKSSSVLRPAKNLNPKWQSIYVYPILEAEHYENETSNNLQARVEAAWKQIVSYELPKIEAVLAEAGWLANAE